MKKILTITVCVIIAAFNLVGCHSSERVRGCNPVICSGEISENINWGYYNQRAETLSGVVEGLFLIGFPEIEEVTS